MIWVRRGCVFLLSLLLLVSLVGGVLTTSANLNVTHPAKLEAWLKQSNVYSSVVTNELKNAQQSASNDTGAGRVSLSDPAVQQAVRSVFSPQVLQQYTVTVLNANYAWLQGKTGSPSFTIDLSSAKQKLAEQVGQTVNARVATLPACSTAQLAQLQATLNTDPLSIPCLLPGLTPESAGQQVTNQIMGSNDFLNHPVITAASLNPNQASQGQPYYQKFSEAPKLYRLELKSPWIFGALALLSTLGIIFIAPRRYKGVRRVGIVLLIAGIVLVAVKFASDSALNRLERHVFNNTSAGQLQQSLTDFLHRVETPIVKVDLWGGIAFLVLALILLIILWFTRQRSATLTPGTESDTKTPRADDTPTATPETSQPVFKQPSRPKRSPRLIQ